MSRGVGNGIAGERCFISFALPSWLEKRCASSPGTAVRECERRKTIVIKDGFDYSLQRTSILMGKQYNLNNPEAELLTLCSCRRLIRPQFQNNTRLRFRAGYEGIYRLSVCVCCLCVCVRVGLSFFVFWFTNQSSDLNLKKNLWPLPGIK